MATKATLYFILISFSLFAAYANAAQFLIRKRDLRFCLNFLSSEIFWFWAIVLSTLLLGFAHEEVFLFLEEYFQFIILPTLFPIFLGVALAIQLPRSLKQAYEAENLLGVSESGKKILSTFWMVGYFSLLFLLGRVLFSLFLEPETAIQKGVLICIAYLVIYFFFYHPVALMIRRDKKFVRQVKQHKILLKAVENKDPSFQPFRGLSVKFLEGNIRDPLIVKQDKAWPIKKFAGTMLLIDVEALPDKVFEDGTVHLSPLKYRYRRKIENKQAYRNYLSGRVFILQEVEYPKDFVYGPLLNHKKNFLDFKQPLFSLTSPFSETYELENGIIGLDCVYAVVNEQKNDPLVVRLLQPLKREI